MIIKKVARLCKETKCICLYDEPAQSIQWIGTGAGMYPLRGLPRADIGQIMRIFDIPQKDETKYYTKHSEELPTEIETRDIPTCSESLLPPPDITISYGGKDLLPLNGGNKTIWIDQRYISPIADVSSIEFYKRTEEGKIYIAAKTGMLVEAIIMPIIPGETMLRRMAQLGAVPAWQPNDLTTGEEVE